AQAVSGAMGLQHVVLFSFAPELCEKDEAEMLSQIRSWPELIGGIDELRVGRSSSTERTRDYSHLMYMVVADEEALRAYQRHPLHEAFAAFVVERGGTVLAFDYNLDAETVVLPR
ncbi:MAG: Dabb family protein, partial [Acidimicrobiales bacterium]